MNFMPERNFLRIRRKVTTTTVFEVVDNRKPNDVIHTIGSPQSKSITTFRQLSPVEQLLYESWVHHNKDETNG